VEEDLRPAQVGDGIGDKEIVEVEEKTLVRENNETPETIVIHHVDGWDNGNGILLCLHEYPIQVNG